MLATYRKIRPLWAIGCRDERIEAEHILCDLAAIEGKSINRKTSKETGSRLQWVLKIKPWRILMLIIIMYSIWGTIKSNRFIIIERAGWLALFSSIHRCCIMPSITCTLPRNNNKKWICVVRMNGWVGEKARGRCVSKNRSIYGSLVFIPVFPFDTVI